MADIEQFKREAEASVAQGDHAKAVELYMRLAAAEPGEAAHRVTIAEQLLKLNRMPEAIQWYEKAAKRYAAQGLLPKAVTVAKMILYLDPEHRQTQELLSALYARKEGSVVLPAAAPEPPPVPARPKPVAEDGPALSLELLDEFEPPPETDSYFFGAGADALYDAEGSEEVVILDDDDESDEIVLGEAEIEILQEEEEFAELEVLDPEAPRPSAEELISRLPRVPVFSDLNRAEFERLIDHVEVRRYETGDAVLREGDRSDAFYIVTGGTARVVKKDFSGRELELATLGENSVFGEFAYLSRAPRNASVLASEPLEVLEFSRETLDRLCAEHPRVKAVLKKLYRDRVLHNLLSICPLFSGMEARKRRALLKAFTYLPVSPGKVILREAEPGAGLYVIARGEVAVHTRAAGELARLREGDFFGEMSLLSGAPASATVTATGRTGLVRLAPEAYEKIEPDFPDVVATLRRVADARRKANAGRTA